MNKKKLIVLTLILAAAIAPFLKIYLVSHNCGGTVFWRTDEAYIIAGSGSDGYRTRAIQYPLIVLTEYLGAVTSANERRVAFLVFHITPTSLERREIDFGTQTGSTPENITPFAGGLYAKCPGVILCKWSGDRFRPVTEEEQKQVGGLEALNPDPVKNPMNGWSARRFPYSPGERFEIEVGKTLTITAKNNSSDARGNPNISVDLLRAGQAPENLYNVDGAVRTVSGNEYKRIFGDTHGVED
jgi:hypothetical protein